MIIEPFGHDAHSTGGGGRRPRLRGTVATAAVAVPMFALLGGFHGEAFAARMRALPVGALSAAWAAGRPMPKRQNPVAAVTVSRRQCRMHGYSARLRET